MYRPFGPRAICIVGAATLALAGCAGDPPDGRNQTTGGGTGTDSVGASTQGTGGTSTGVTGINSGTGGTATNTGSNATATTNDTGSSTGASTTGPYTVPESAYLPARIRRLTNAEYDTSVRALLGSTQNPSVDFSFPPDARQGPTSSPAGAAFTLNDAQRVDPVLASKLDTAALSLVAEARSNGKLAALSPCASTAGASGEACAKTFVQTFGAKVYRRALVDDEVNALVVGATAAYHVAADGYTYNDGIDLITRILLESAGFLYVTELGDATSTGASFQLTPDETAASLSYLLTAGPPDDTLSASSKAGMLDTPDGREAEARRLFPSLAGRARMVRVVREWLGIDNVANRDKAASVYPDFASVSASMDAEAYNFVDELVTNGTGTVSELLDADWTVVDTALGNVYGVTSPGVDLRTSLTGVTRRGILNQAAFLSVFATNNGSHPVFRGVTVLRRVACANVEDPSKVGIVVSFPAADPTLTTRERFENHVQPACAGCHTSIDAVGFTFEEYDGMGQSRTTENNKPIDSSATIAAGTDFDGTYADSSQLAAALASSPSVHACVARQLFRSSAGRSDGTIDDSENAFLELWKRLPTDQQDRLVDVLVAYVRSPLFTQRKMP